VAASVTGAVGSVTGNVGGNVTGTVASVVGAVGSVTGDTPQTQDHTAAIAAIQATASAIPTTAMRGTDNASLASVIGAAVGVSISADIAAVQTTASAIPTTAMRGTDNGATAAAMTVAQNDLDLLTGTDGATLATAQGNYAPAKVADIPTAAQNFTAILTTQLTEAYAADGTAPTLAQAILLIQQSLHEFAITSTTRTVKKLDGSTTAATFTLDSATVPTSTTRAT